MGEFNFDDDHGDPRHFDESEYGPGPDEDEELQDVAAQEAADAEGDPNVDWLVDTLSPEKKKAPVSQSMSDAESADYMDEVVRRMDVAACYRLLLENPLFDDSNENTAIVEREMRQFAQDRLKVLMGVSSDTRPIVPVVKLPFNEEEIQTLKVFASLSANELMALKTLAAIALKKKDLVPSPKAEPAQQDRKVPALRKRAVAPVKPPAPARAPAPAPKPPATKAVRPAPALRRPQAPKPAPAAQPEKKAVELPNGDVKEVTARHDQRAQKPAGRVPFPDNASFTFVSADVAARAAKVSEAAANHEMRNPKKD